MLLVLEKAPSLVLARWLGTRPCNEGSTALEVEMTRALPITSHSLEQLDKLLSRARIGQDLTTCGERVQTHGVEEDRVMGHHQVLAVMEAKVEAVGWTPSAISSAIRDGCALHFRRLWHGLAFDQNGSITYGDDDYDLDSMYQYILETSFMKRTQNKETSC